MMMTSEVKPLHCTSSSTDELYGLHQQDLAEIERIFNKFPAVEEAILFGSRAKRTYRKGSDVDIALKGRKIDYGLVNILSALLNEESTMPYFFDIVHYDTLTNEELRAHIDRVGKRIFCVRSEE